LEWVWFNKHNKSNLFLFRCHHCSGTGKVIKKKCHVCEATKTINSYDNASLFIEKGIADG